MRIMVFLRLSCLWLDLFWVLQPLWFLFVQQDCLIKRNWCYWSDAHTFFNNPYCCGLEWVNIDSDRLNYVFPGKVLIPVKQYYSERKGDLNCLNSEIASIYWHKPCEEIYTKLQLKYLKGSNSAFVDGAGELVCFDGSELIGRYRFLYQVRQTPWVFEKQQLYISVDIFVREAHIDSFVWKVGFTTQGNTHVFCLLSERR